MYTGKRVLDRPTTVLTAGLLLAFAMATVPLAPAWGQPGGIIAESTFENNDEGWTVWDTQQGELTPDWFPGGGNPGGNICESDPGPASFGFVAPALFLGDLSLAFGCQISYDLKTNAFDPGGRNMAITVESPSGSIANSTLMTTTDTWVAFQYTFDQTGGWTDLNSVPVTDNQIGAVLSNVTRILIGAETIVGTVETTCLDNVRITAACPPPSCVDPPPGMVAWWTLDETETNRTTVEDAVGGHTGVRINAPTQVVGKVDVALDLDGANDYVEVADDPALNFGTGSFSIDAWILLDEDSEGAWFPIVNKSDRPSGTPGYEFRVTHPDRTLSLVVAGSGSSQTYTSLESVPTGVWTHVAVSFFMGARTQSVSYLLLSSLSTEWLGEGFWGIFSAMWTTRFLSR